MIAIARNTGIDADSIAETEGDHFGNCPVCGAYLDMRDLGQFLDRRSPEPHRERPSH